MKDYKFKIGQKIETKSTGKKWIVMGYSVQWKRDNEGSWSVPSYYLRPVKNGNIKITSTEIAHKTYQSI